MIVGIDNISPGASTGLNALGGMRTYLGTLVEKLPLIRPDWSFKLFTPASASSLSGSLPRNLELVECRVPLRREFRIAYEQIALPRKIKQQRVDVWLGTCNTLPLRLGCRSALIIQSLQYFTNPQAYSRVRRRYLQFVVPRSVHRTNAVIALSETSKSDIVRRFNVRPSHVAVVYHSVPKHVTDSFLTSESDRDSGSELDVCLTPFILFVSALYPYKNVHRLIEALSLLKTEFPHNLVVSGSDTPELTQTQLREWAATLGVADRLITLGRTTNTNLAVLYRRADVMALPSLDETFGFPVLEAMYMGCPVLTSAESSMAEIGGDAVVSVDPHSAQAIANGLRQILSRPEQRQHMSQRGRERADLFDQTRMLRQLAAVIELAGKTSRSSIGGA